MKNIIAKFYIIGLVFAVGVPLQSIAADWTDESGNEYTALKSIKGSGSAYIKTEIIPAGTETVKLKFRPTVISGKSTTKGLNEALFCSRDADIKAQFSGFKLANQIRIDRDGEQTKSTATLSAPNQDYVIVADFAGGTASFAGGTASIDDTTWEISSKSEPYDNPPTANLYLYASYTGDGSPNNKGYYWLYYFQMYSSAGVLEHNFMPAKRGDVIGLYDTVERKFYAPTGGSFANSTTRTVTAPSGCKKWTGLGADNKMSTGANWEGGVAPDEGDDLDFTLAAPLAKINADMGGVTFGKVWIDDGDLPGFTNKLTATSINDLERMKDYAEKTADFSFTLAAPVGQDFVWNGGDDANWNTTDSSWLCNSAASVWYDHNNAIFNTAGDTATLTKDATANSLVFNQNATVDGAATLTVPTVSVAQNVSATIDAPIAGALVKTGAGTLTLKSSRSEATTLSEGTLVFSGNDTKLDWSKLTLGDDPAKPVTLRFEDGAALASESAECIFGNVAGITSTICKSGGDWTRSGHTRIRPAAGANTTLVNESGNLIFNKEFTVGAQTAANATGSSELAIAGGKVAVSGSTGKQWVSVGSYGPGIVTVTNNAAFEVTLNIAFSLHSGSGTLNVSDGGKATIGGEIILGSISDDAGTGTVNIGRRGTVIADSIRCESYGRGIVNFDGGTLKAGEEGKTLIQPSERMTVNVGLNGGVIDNDGKSIIIAQKMTGDGGMTFSGSGTTTISANQEYTGTTTVLEGTTLSVGGGVAFAGSVKFESGSKLNIANYTAGVTPFAAAKSLILPEDEGKVSLTLNGGAFGEGSYVICSASGMTETNGEKFKFDTEGDLVGKWSVDGNMLILTIGEIDPNVWTGHGGDGKMSTGANWGGNAVPAAGSDIDLSGITAATTIIADANRTFGAVTMGTGVITFTNAMAATSFVSEATHNPTAKIAVAADSTVTIVGDLVFATNSACYVCYSIAEGGMFAVTGDIIATDKHKSYVIPCQTASNAGVISAKGLVNNINKSDNDYFALARELDNALAKWVIGEDGLSGTKRFYVVRSSGATVMITAATNFTISAAVVPKRNLTLDPAGYEITLGTNTSAQSGGILGGASGENGLTSVIGTGKVIVNYNVDNLTTAAAYKTHPFTVKSGATLALVTGANIGTGLLTVEDGGTLEIAESGTVTHNGNLSLENGAALAFNFTDRKTAPVLALAEGKAVTFTEAGEIAVKITGDVWPIGGDYVLTACGGFNAEGVTVSLAEGAPKWAKGIGVNEEGNIVLTVRPKSTMIIVR